MDRRGIRTQLVNIINIFSLISGSKGNSSLTILQIDIFGGQVDASLYLKYILVVESIIYYLFKIIKLILLVNLL